MNEIPDPIDYVAFSFDKNQLSEAFDKVKNKNHWKDPIDAVIPEADLVVTILAIQFFTATTPTLARCYYTDERVNEIFYHIWSIGYRQGPAGDH